MSTTCMIFGRESFGEGEEEGFVEVEAGELEVEFEDAILGGQLKSSAERKRELEDTPDLS